MVIGITAGVIVIVVGILIAMKPRAPQPKTDIKTAKQLTAYFTRVAASNSPPALSVVVVKNGKTVYSEGFGISNRFLNMRADGNTVYHWWSMTKIVTAIAVLQLSESGELDLDDPIVKYLPYFKASYKKQIITDISIRQVLTHSSGLPDAVPEIIKWVHLDGDPPSDQTELVKRHIDEYDSLLFEPDSKSRYTNWGYMILGAVIEAASGQSYEEYVKRNILKPLHMDSTNFIYTSAMAENEAIGTQHVVDVFTPLIPMLKIGYIIDQRIGMRYYFKRMYNDQTPPSGLIGSAQDVGKLMTAYLKNDNLLLDLHTVRTVNSILAELSDPGESMRGIGWEAQLSNDGRKILTHSGGGPGFSTIMRVYPEEDLGIVIMGNDSSMKRNQLADVVAGVKW